MAKQNKGWTHPDHWKVALVATLCQLLAALLFVYAFAVTPAFKDIKTRHFEMFSVNVKCEDTFCYDESATPEKASPKHVSKVHKDNPGWMAAARVLIGIGGVTNFLSLALIVVIFWPCVLVGKICNCLLHICRFLDFFGAPTKFIGCFLMISNISQVNVTYSKQSYQDVLAINPLPIGLVLYSYILQTLCFAFITVATDVGAKGQDTHVDRLRFERVSAEEENMGKELSKSVSYHPIDKKRSSRLLADVEGHYQRHESLI